MRATIASGYFLRILLLASVGVIGSIWALVRFYTHVMPSMVVPVPSASASADWPSDAGVIPAPEIEVVPGGR